MFDKQTETKINEAVALELTNVCKTYGKSYHSLHEGYAVLLEEIEEAEKDFEYIKNHLMCLWENVKLDDVISVKGNARSIAYDAVELAKEAVQVAAVCTKIQRG